jgi:8-oxo-dGTP diphosphatase
MSSQDVGVGVACTVWRDGKFLMMKRQGAHASGTWSIPGGHLEFGETWEAAAVREVLEETGMEITDVKFMAATNDIMTSDKKHYVTIWMTADWAANEPEILEPEKCSAIGWYDFSSLPQPLFEPCYQNLRAVKPELFAN